MVLILTINRIKILNIWFFITQASHFQMDLSDDINRKEFIKETLDDTSVACISESLEKQEEAPYH